MPDNLERQLKIELVANAETLRRGQRIIDNLNAEVLFRFGRTPGNTTPPPNWEQTLAIAAHARNPLYADEVEAWGRAHLTDPDMDVWTDWDSERDLPKDAI